MSTSFPQVIRLKGRRYVRRTDAETYKCGLAGLPFKADPNAPEMLVPVRQFAAELAVCVKTVSRRIAEGQRAAAVSEIEAA